MNTRASRLSLPPGPPLLPVLGNIELLRDPNPLLLLHKWRHQYGDVMRWKVGPRQLVFVNDPEGIKHVLATNHDNYTKGVGYARLKPLLGEGLLTSEGALWRRQRRLAQPAFHRKQIDALAEHMVAAAQKMILPWAGYAKRQEAFDVNESMMRVTLEIVCRALFGTGVTEQEYALVAEALALLLHETTKRAMRPWFIELPTKVNRLYREYVVELNRIIFRIIAERRASGESKSDLLGMLLEARDEETGEQMNDQQLRDEVMTLFLAGHETTANALTWSWVVLSQYPMIRAQVQEEIQAVVGDRAPTAADMGKLVYMRSVFDEIMRIYPPIPSFARRAIHEDEIGGYRVEAGSNVLICPAVLHRHPALWPNPEGFDPSRFTEANKKRHHKFAYLPFGGGPRFCIGNNFAVMEAMLILTVVSQVYELQLAPHQSIEFELSLTLRPKDGVLAFATPRQ